MYFLCTLPGLSTNESVGSFGAVIVIGNLCNATCKVQEKLKEKLISSAAVCTRTDGTESAIQKWHFRNSAHTIQIVVAHILNGRSQSNDLVMH